MIWPVEEFRDKPVGSDPLVTDHVYGVVPPEAVRVAEYVAPSCASGKSPVKIVRDDPVAAIATVKDFAAVCAGELESFTWTEKLYEPAVVGVPLIAPLDEFRVKPVGRLPVDTVQLYGVVPPVACKVAEYDAPTVPPANVEVEMERVGVAAATAMLRDAVAVLLLASVTLTVNEDAPDAVGVPEMAPEETFKLSPPGSEPLLTVQEYGVVPPVA